MLLRDLAANFVSPTLKSLATYHRDSEKMIEESGRRLFRPLVILRVLSPTPDNLITKNADNISWATGEFLFFFFLSHPIFTNLLNFYVDRGAKGPSNVIFFPSTNYYYCY